MDGEAESNSVVHLTSRCDTTFAARRRRLAGILPNHNKHIPLVNKVSHNRIIRKIHDKGKCGRSPKEQRDAALYTAVRGRPGCRRLGDKPSFSKSLSETTSNHSIHQ